jgi:polar amino acid transport system substrate-binding protein
MTTRQDDLLLCVSELATNALLHGVPPGRGYRVRLVRFEDAVRVEVHDSGGGVPRLRAAGGGAAGEGAGGRGLRIVDALADRWGVEGREGPGKAVWCEFFDPPLGGSYERSPRLRRMTNQSIVEDLAPKGVLRVSINLGNPVLAQGTPDAPAGITVDIARELAGRLGLPVEFLCFDAARKSFEAMADGRADICFLAVEPAREAEVAFTAPYVLIEGVYAVPAGSGIAAVADVDRPGVRIGVKEGSAYDLYLTRTLEHAELVRGAEGVDVFREQGLEVGAGIRQPMTAYAAAHPEVRLIGEGFMQIRQALGTTVARKPETVAYLREFVEELKAGGFVADALRRAGQSETLAAPAGA